MKTTLNEMIKFYTNAGCKFEVSIYLDNEWIGRVTPETAMAEYGLSNVNEYRIGKNTARQILVVRL